MNVIMESLYNIDRNTFDIGYVGEKNHTKVIINCISIFRNYPNAVASMTAKPPVGDLYPVSLTRDGVSIIWEISESDIANAGSGQYQLTFTNGSGDSEEIIKTVFGSYSVKASLSPSGEAPTPIENWIDEANAVLADLESFDDISASATALAAGADPTAEITEVEGHKNIALGIPAGASGEMVTETVTGTTPSITGVANHRYLCGEVSTISITPPASGIIDVIFTSGTTAAVLTIPNTVTLPAWFDATSLETSVTYEINIADGFGVVAKWA